MRAGGERDRATVGAELEGRNGELIVDEEAGGVARLGAKRVGVGAADVEGAFDDEGAFAGFLNRSDGQVRQRAGFGGCGDVIGDAFLRADVEFVGQAAGRDGGTVEQLRGECADGERAVVALNHERAARGFRFSFKQGAARGAADLDVFVDEITVEEHAEEFGVGDFFAGVVEPRGAEFDAEVLPETGGASGVSAGRGAVVAFVALAAGGVPAIVDAAAIRGLRRGGLAPAVEELHLVAAHKVDAGVGAGGEEEIEIEFDVGVIPGGD